MVSSFDSGATAAATSASAAAGALGELTGVVDAGAGVSQLQSLAAILDSECVWHLTRRASSPSSSGPSATQYLLSPFTDFGPTLALLGNTVVIVAVFHMPLDGCPMSGVVVYCGEKAS